MKDAGSDFSRYRGMMSGLAAPVLAAVTPAGCEAARLQPSVAQAAPAAALLLAPEAVVHSEGLASGMKHLASLGRAHASGDRKALKLRDGGGHTRDVYHPFALWLHLAAFAACYEKLPLAVWSACEDSLPDALLPVMQVQEYADALPPSPRVALTLWQALCLSQAAILTQRDVDLELADSVVHQTLQQQGEAGSLHPVSEDERTTPEVWTYRELCALHALANLALLRRHQAWAKRVEEAAMHHVERTQPDYTTSQPWGVFAFAWSARSRSFAEQQLHDAQAYAEGPLPVLSALLLADAAASMRLFA